MGARPSIAATGSAWVGALALGLTLVGPATASFGWLSPAAGFRLFLLGALLLALIAFVTGGIGVLRTLAASGRPGRGRAWLGAGIGLGLLALAVVASLPGRGLPAINDITTNPDDPPVFVVSARQLGDARSYPGDSFAAQQRAAYPDLAPLELDVSPSQAFERARRAAESLGLEIVASDRAAGTLEAQDVSAIFRFVDDVAVRVRSSARGSVVDIRSKSRDGRGDLGVNARRIRALAAAIRGES